MTVAEPQFLEKTKLRGREPISRTAIHGWPSFLFGIPFAASGMVIVLLWSGIVEIDPGKVHAPMWVIGIFGGLFLLAGLSFMWHGLSGVRRNARIPANRKTHAGSPWLWDYEWHALGISDNKFKKMLRGLIMMVVMISFLAPFHWWAFVSKDGTIMVKGMVIFFDLVFGLSCSYYLIHNLALYLKYGNSRLRFGNFPFFLGDKLSVVLVGLPSEIRRLQLDLRYIEEVYEKRQRRNKTEVEVVCYQLYHETRTLQGAETGASGKLSLEWVLPEDSGLSSDLSGRPARFWELEVKADTPGVDYHSRFLLPIYAHY